MWPYWLLFLLSALAALAHGRLPARQARRVWGFVALLLAVMMGFRHQVGGDWWTYLRQFEDLRGVFFRDLFDIAKDPGYASLAWLVMQVGGTVHLLNFLCALPLAFGTILVARRQPRPTLALLAAVPYLLIVVGMGYTRQSAAIGFAMLGLVALGDRRQRAFVAWILVAAAFHKSAVLLLPIAALAATSHRSWTYFWVGIVTLVGAWVFLSDSADTLVQSYVVSDYADASQGATTRVLMNAVPSFLALIFRRSLFPDDAERKLWVWIAVISLLCLPLLAVSATGVDRMSLYFIPLQLVVFARLPRTVKETQLRTLVVIGSIVYYGTVQFVWLNFASHAFAWLPYRFMPLW